MLRNLIYMLQIMVILIAGCSSHEPDIDLSAEKLGGVSLQNRFSSADKEKIKTIETITIYQDQNGLRIAVDNQNKIKWVELRAEADSTLSTNRGIQINDTYQDMKKDYGEPTKKRHEQGAGIFAYHDKRSSITLEFWIIDEKINMIKLLEE